METQMNRTNEQVVELIEGLMAQERLTMEQCRQQEAQATEPKLKSLILRLSETHAHSCAELGAYLNEVRSQNEITLQINEMFL